MMDGLNNITTHTKELSDEPHELNRLHNHQQLIAHFPANPTIDF